MMNLGTYISIASNSSRFRCRLRKAAARFLTRRASRLLSPDTSGGTKSFVVIRSPELRGLFEAFATGGEDSPGMDNPVSIEMDGWGGFEGGGETDDEGDDTICTSGKSNTWWVGKHSCCSFWCVESGVARAQSILDAGGGESVVFEPTEIGGEGGKG